ncbi:recombinational DNA repair ATPase [Moorella thermoacetica Y72]|uniref:Recombinational DNA repair ATPase n=1 Tax=Moorella thermoacetica Y72 TaxID=1325331 RepID=A0A0S6UB45_NEOTH|nr:recombinational DNA repair ATPase [Moorella thermoacetica Y72]
MITVFEKEGKTKDSELLFYLGHGSRICSAYVNCANLSLFNSSFLVT